MGRIRTIKPEFPQSESVGRLSRDARLVFILLWTVADDQGRSRAASRMLASLLFPYDDDAPELMDAWLTELEDTDHIRRYVVDGTTYLQILNWQKHQRVDRPTPSRFPEFREEYAMPRVALASIREGSTTDLGPRTKDIGSNIITNICPKPAAPLPDQNLFDGGLDTPPAKNPPAKRGRNQYPEDFETFWREYPTDPGMSKIEAAKAWEKLPPDRRLAARQAIPKFRDWVQNQGPNYRVVHAVRYLTQGRFDGFTAPPQPQTGPPADRRIMTPLGTELARRLQYHGAAAFNPESNWLEWTDKGISDGCRLNYPPAPDGYQPEVDL
jgi:hypothetical protein